MDFLWSLFEPLVILLQNLMEFFYRMLASMGHPSYGVAIILLTIVIKMLLYPLTVKQIKSMKAMQELQPKMKRIQEQYGTNPQLMNQEMQKLYHEMGVNPLAGCLPLLVQMPILMAIFYALRDATYAGGDASFLWLPSLTETDPYYILPLLSAITTYITSAQTMDPSNQQMKIMTYMMPVIIGYMSTNFAAGLVIYWVTMNCVQMAQQWFLFRETDKPVKKQDTIIDVASKEVAKKKNKKKKGK